MTSGVGSSRCVVAWSPNALQRYLRLPPDTTLMRTLVAASTWEERTAARTRCQDRCQRPLPSPGWSRPSKPSTSSAHTLYQRMSAGTGHGMTHPLLPRPSNAGTAVSRPTGRRAVRYDNRNTEQCPHHQQRMGPVGAGHRRPQFAVGQPPQPTGSTVTANGSGTSPTAPTNAATWAGSCDTRPPCSNKPSATISAQNSGCVWYPSPNTNSDARDVAAVAEATVDAMAEQVDCVTQAVLWDPQHGRYGIIDLLIRADVVDRLFGAGTTEPGVAASGIGGGRHYVCVDIKYKTLRLLNGGGLSNTGSFPAYKTQLHVYNRALGRVQGSHGGCPYVPARTRMATRPTAGPRTAWTVSALSEPTKQSTGCACPNGPTGPADGSGGYAPKGTNGTCCPPPPSPNSSANAGSRHLRWGPTLRRVAEQARDLTVLHHVGPAGRDRANQAGMVRWDDPTVSSSRLGLTGKPARRLDQLLTTNRSVHETRCPARPRPSRPSRMGHTDRTRVLRRLRNRQRRRRPARPSTRSGVAKP